jgi:hypothetical protein
MESPAKRQNKLGLLQQGKAKFHDGHPPTPQANSSTGLAGEVIAQSFALILIIYI